MGYFLFWLLMAAITAMVGGSKGGNGFLWFLGGFFLWPIFLPAALLTKPSAKLVKREAALAEHRALQSGSMRKCPACAELIKSEALVCRFCGLDPLPEATPAPPPGSLPPWSNEKK